MDEKDLKEMFRKTFDTVAEGYDSSAMRFFPASAKHISSFLSLNGNEQVLDVATGTGNAALILADNLPGGHVTGIDFSKGMLAQAKKKVEALKTSNVTFMEMDMQALDFPDNNFDVSVSAFSIFFIDDMEKQLRHISSKVKSGGKIVTTTFFENTFSPLVNKFLERLEKYNIEIPPLAWKRVATEDKCITLFNSINLIDVSCHMKESGYYLKDASDWWYIIWNGGFRGLVSQLSTDDLERFKEEHLREVQELSSKDGIWLEMNILFTMGTKK